MQILVDWDLEGQKKISVGIYFSKNLLGSCYRKQRTLFRPKLRFDRSLGMRRNHELMRVFTRNSLRLS